MREIVLARHRARLLPSTQHILSAAGTDYRCWLNRFGALTVTWDVSAADHTTGDETYDLYITTGDGSSAWDLAHFPQVITTGVKQFIMRIERDLLPQNVTTAGPGVAAVDTASLKTDTAGSSQGIKTLTAGSVRHGAFGDRIGWQLVLGGTTPIITHSILITAGP
jgi:hypothetical protein